MAPEGFGAPVRFRLNLNFCRALVARAEKKPSFPRLLKKSSYIWGRDTAVRWALVLAVFRQITDLKFNSLPLKIYPLNRKVVFQPSFLRGKLAVKLRGCTSYIFFFLKGPKKAEL